MIVVYGRHIVIIWFWVFGQHFQPNLNPIFWSFKCKSVDQKALIYTLYCYVWLISVWSGWMKELFMSHDKNKNLVFALRPKNLLSVYQTIISCKTDRFFFFSFSFWWDQKWNHEMSLRKRNPTIISDQWILSTRHCNFQISDFFSFIKKGLR